ncbi:MAG: tRNA preQ1(34) S-adenosylmethionine ribosyltransferase-isomerase QueA [Oscillospiraceae bacterium]
MQRSMFNYALPKELIAQHPAEPRDSARLMVIDRTTGQIQDHIFREIESFLQKGDVLVINDSKVIPARLLGKKKVTGAAAELLLLKDLGDNNWECLAKPGKRLKIGSQIEFGDELLAEIIDEVEGGNRIVKFSYAKGKSFYEILDRIGLMPLPHYITAPLTDNSEYQTVYANENGSAAAPTAGLHFTDELLDRIKSKGVSIAKVTLHVGLGTFRPVKADDISDHHMHSEHFVISEQAAQTINEAKRSGGRIIGVGTTSCRTLESAMKKHGAIVPCSEDTDIFIFPGYEFRALDGLITNFHLPESTLIMLVSAFLGYEATMNAYKYAVENKYRFFSFGDAMFIANQNK